MKLPRQKPDAEVSGPSKEIRQKMEPAYRVYGEGFGVSIQKKNYLFRHWAPVSQRYAGSRSVEVIMHAKAEIFDFAVEELPVGGVAVIVFQENLKFSAHYVGIFKLETRPG